MLEADVKEVSVIGDSKVFIGSGLLKDIPKKCFDAGLKPAVFVIISDENVFKLFGEELKNVFSSFAKTLEKSPRVLSYSIKPGEPSKCREVKANLEDFMCDNRCNRDTVVVALGGGVVGDLSGFVAATFMRGVPVVQIPTSVMAMVDSSVGGKTAINVPAGKNLIGAFHQPRLIFADMFLLKTLHEREFVEGIAESIKMGVIRDSKLFDLLEAKAELVKAFDPTVCAEVIYESIRHKAHVVKIDEKEQHVRSTLNYGHTIGHAIEAFMSPAMLHGECVSVGCVLEADLACRLGHISKDTITRIQKCFEAYGLPVSMPALPEGKGVSELMGKMAMDKKNAGGAIRCTIIKGVGESFDCPQPVARDIMEAVLKDALDSGGRPWKRAKH
eukprot:gnl/MRDRNA2_/MRDRNA2_94361_c0_seq1.p1 gnl/MRDRNA2_/MRDRNA2_94361_c0~~gnl/MRDRNA2_/MRDRNA2_94361_c0_seq1.p1  ORF type:complete len:386 (+),score=72.53 gnl/MRDRNA2_/MRDRNA2_94361_c0_seq1:71-1228(+)